MIEASYYPDICKITVQGHANYAPIGEDIVCAGVSALEYALVASLEVTGDCGYEGRFDTDGDVIEAKHPSPTVKSWFELIWRGIEAISEQYPDNVRVRVV